LAIWQCRIRQTGDWSQCRFSIAPDKEALTLMLPTPMAGKLQLRIEYQGRINDQLGGFYRSRFEKDGQIRYIAVTQFQESDARRAFPCMDHPQHKAEFEVTLTVPNHLTAVTNTLAADEQELDGNQKKIRFAPTPKMSTYLLFFGLGEFEMVQDSQDSRVRVLHLPGLAHTTQLGLTFGRKALQFCEHYYDIPYPLPKMDLIAVPDFAFGAMENWGAITFRENLLLNFPEVTSKAGIQRICEVIAHEIAHQWFGNLVTPADWKYLWLNESFATYFGYGVVDHHHPQWGTWDQFLINETATALARDGLQETIAIEMPGVEKVAINSSTAPIIYNKGASVLRMIEGLIGTEFYQKGVRRYLDQHRYACAQSQDLWQAFEQASDQPVTEMMQSWISQPGHPLINVERNGDRLVLDQKRFTYLNRSSDQWWVIPVKMTVWDQQGNAESQTVLIRQEPVTVDLPEDTAAYKLNSDQTGFYRVAYQDRANLAALGNMVADKTLSATDRWGLENDLYALLRQGSLPLTDYLEFLRHYADERDYLPTASIIGHLMQAYLTAPLNLRPVIAQTGVDITHRVLDHIGNLPREGESQTTAILRDQLIWAAALWGHSEVTAFARSQFEAMMTNETIPADIAGAVMRVGALGGGQAALDWLTAKFAASHSEHERINILTALGAFDTWELVEQALAFALENVPARNNFIPIAAAAHNPAAQEHLWQWYLDHLSTLEGFHPLLYERVITSLWPSGGMNKTEEVLTFGRGYIEKFPGLADAVALAMENLQINQCMRQNTP
jgi:tricorn protease interacting factor F2/3